MVLSSYTSTLLLVLYFVSFIDQISSKYVDPEILVRKLPKIELHAHLHGSIRLPTLNELSLAAGAGPVHVTVSDEHSGQVEKPFELFPLIHKVVTTKDIVLRILSEMIEDFMAENVIYLEIRTTPRALPDGTSASEYVRLLTHAIATHNALPHRTMLVKLIVSIDRGRSHQDALQTLSLLEQFSTVTIPPNTDTSASSIIEKVIVGVDFSGNPLGGKFMEFQSIFQEIRQLGFNITIHTAEAEELLDADNYDETDAILDFMPDRVGHMLFLHERHLQKVFALKQAGKCILIEICPSTSYFVLNLRSYADHPYIRKLYSMHQPISLNTDDIAIFNTTLTKEILHMMYALDWTVRDIVSIQAHSLPYVFASPSEKAWITHTFWQQLSIVQQEYNHKDDQADHANNNNDNNSNTNLQDISEDTLDTILDSVEIRRGKLVTSSLEVF